MQSCAHWSRVQSSDWVSHLPILTPICAVDDVAVLGLASVLACDRWMNFAPDDLAPSPIWSSGGLPPFRNTIYTCDRREREKQCEKVDRLIWLVLFLFVCLPRGCCSSELSPTKHSHYIGFCINQTSILWHHLTDLQRHCNGKKHRIRFLVLLLPFPYAYQQSTPNKIFFYVETAYFLVLQKAIRQQKCVNQFDNRRLKIRRMTASFL